MKKTKEENKTEKWGLEIQPPTLTADIVEIQEEGKAAIRKEKASVVHPRSPEERLALMGNAILRKQKKIEEDKEQLKVMIKEHKAMAKVVESYHKIIAG